MLRNSPDSACTARTAWRLRSPTSLARKPVNRPNRSATDEKNGATSPPTDLIGVPSRDRNANAYSATATPKYKRQSVAKIPKAGRSSQALIIDGVSRIAASVGGD